MAAPQGFEPRYADPESAVLPLNEGASSGAQARVPANWHYDPGQGTKVQPSPSYGFLLGAVNQAAMARPRTATPDFILWPTVTTIDEFHAEFASTRLAIAKRASSL